MASETAAMRCWRSRLARYGLGRGFTVEGVAPTDVPVLILGETGSGKELLARAVHERSPRRAGPLVRVNCGAIAPDLMDSELFGHERGAFTGAIAERRGWFERAHGGTLFLDEIGDLPPAAQVRLLRVLQEGEFERVGGHELLRADVRLVAATHGDLRRMVELGQFRQDLWYRISVFPVQLPPLRERKGDLPELATHLVATTCARHGVPQLRLTEADLQLLNRHDWPGNVRELAAVIERAALLGRGQRLELVAALALNAPLVAPAAGEIVQTAEPQPHSTLVEAQRRHIEGALRQARGRIEGAGGAAERLAVNPHTLRARMRKMGLNWATFRA